MVVSVIKIRHFFVEQNAKNFINTGMLLRHATAFGLYITCTATYFIALGIYVWNPLPSRYSLVAYTGIFFNVGSFIS